MLIILWNEELELILLLNYPQPKNKRFISSRDFLGLFSPYSLRRSDAVGNYNNEHNIQVLVRMQR